MEIEFLGESLYVMKGILHSIEVPKSEPTYQILSRNGSPAAPAGGGVSFQGYLSQASGASASQLPSEENLSATPSSENSSPAGERSREISGEERERELREQETQNRHLSEERAEKRRLAEKREEEHRLEERRREESESRRAVDSPQRREESGAQDERVRGEQASEEKSRTGTVEKREGSSAGKSSKKENASEVKEGKGGAKGTQKELSLKEVTERLLAARPEAEEMGVLSSGSLKESHGKRGEKGESRKGGEEKHSLSQRISGKNLAAILESLPSDGKHRTAASDEGKRAGEESVRVSLDPKKWSVARSHGGSRSRDREGRGSEGQQNRSGSTENSLHKPGQESGRPTTILDMMDSFQDRLRTEQSSGTKETLPSQKHLFHTLVERGRMNLGTDGHSSASIRMNPRELGFMTLNLRVEHNRVEATLLVENDRVMKLLKEDLEHLRAEFKSQGIHVESLSVKVKESDQTRSFSSFDQNDPGTPFGGEGASGERGGEAGERNSEAFRNAPDARWFATPVEERSASSGEAFAPLRRDYAGSVNISI